MLTATKGQGCPLTPAAERSPHMPQPTSSSYPQATLACWHGGDLAAAMTSLLKSLPANPAARYTVSLALPAGAAGAFPKELKSRLRGVIEANRDRIRAVRMLFWGNPNDASKAFCEQTVGASMHTQADVRVWFVSGDDAPSKPLRHFASLSNDSHQGIAIGETSQRNERLPYFDCVVAARSATEPTNLLVDLFQECWEAVTAPNHSSDQPDDQNSAKQDVYSRAATAIAGERRR